MAYASHSLPSESVYRPKKLPRVLRRQLPVMRIVAFIGLFGLLVMAVTWKNLTFERLSLDVGIQQAKMETLRKEIQHLDGQIETETAFARVTRWARDKRGWRPQPERAGVVHLSETELTATALTEARVLRSSHE